MSVQSKSPIPEFYKLANPCVLCPNRCLVNRENGETGLCRTGNTPMISSVSLHFGEEKILVGKGGSGTIFFTGCNLKCLYCQNYEISHEMNGKSITVEELAKHMLHLQNLGAENINLVTPSHQIHTIVHALFIARDMGLSLPIVYNCGGYESVETLQLLEGLIDIYMPDIKYGDNQEAKNYSGVNNYIEVMAIALKEMQRQVGILELDKKGVAVRGLLIRHLVLPGGLEGISDSKKVLDFIKNEISPESYVNIMGQYRPSYRAYEYPATIGKRLLYSDYAEVQEYA